MSAAKAARAASRQRAIGAPPAFVRSGALALLLATVLLTVFVRLRLADVPLERDEGEYAYAGQLILAGTPPYAQAYNMKFPGTYYAYALAMAGFGETPSGIRTGLLVVNLATALVVFLLGRRLAGTTAGAVAAVSFLVLSLSPSSLGTFAHATNFVVLPALAGLALLLHAVESNRAIPIAAGGVLLGLALLVKQHGIVYLPLGALLVVWGAVRHRPDRGRTAAVRLGLFAGCAAVPLVVLCAAFHVQGVLERFWFWTFRYAWAYVSEVPVSEAWRNFVEGLGAAAGPNAPLWILAAAGAIPLWFGRHAVLAKIFVTALFVVSFLGVCPGFYFRAHYFVIVLPALALLAGVAVAAAGRGFAGSGSPARWAVVAVAFAALVGACLYPQRALLFSLPANRVSRTLFGANPFPEAVEVARYLREHTGPADRVAVIGSEPQIYFYAGRRAATGYIYTYGLMEPQPYAATMQREMRDEIESAHPLYLVEVQVPTSWLIRPQSDRSILSWAARYTERCYELAGIADIVTEDRTNYVWDEDVRGYQRSSKFALLVHRRKSSTPCTAGQSR